MNGWLGGVHAGYNIQSGKWVYGIEADIQATDQDGSVSLCAVAGCGAGTAFVAANHRLDWFGTVRGRLGLLMQPNLLLYGTGGLAYGQVSSDYTFGLVGVTPTVSFGDSSMRTGWVIGGGVEGMLNRNWLLRAEYLYMDLGDSGSSGSATQSATFVAVDKRFVVDGIANGSLRNTFTDQIFRVGLSYKFD
jgi:outer membrane immunogenic protein